MTSEPQDPDRVALVTGAGSGIGAAIARRLAISGYAVVVLDRDGARASEVASELADGGAVASHHAVDVTDPDGVAGAVEETVRRFGRLDAAVNNAAVTGVRARIEDYPLNVWRRVLDVDVTGVLVCLREELRQMRRQGHGAVVNMASAAGVAGVAGSSAYAAAKHGVLGLTRTAAVEYAGDGVRVNAVCPGLVRTPMVSGAGVEGFAEAHPLGRAAEPEEVAATVAWLLGSDASFVTGASVAVDGGLTAGVAGL